MEDIEKKEDKRRRSLEILQQAQTCYSAMARFRHERERNKRYNYGDQFSDIVCVNGRRMTEEQYIRSQGNVPLKNNLIRRLVRNVVGVYRSQSTEPTCVARDREEQELAETMSTMLQYNMQLNRMTELNARTMEEFLISGLAVHRKSFGWRNGRLDCWTDYVQPNNFFLDTNVRDFRGWDCGIVGEIHDVDFPTLCTQFATSPGEYDRLAEIYRAAADTTTLLTAWSDFGYGRETVDLDFLSPRQEDRFRVIEVWRLESRPRYRCHDPRNGELFRCEAGDLAAMVDVENARRVMDGVREAASDGKALVPLITAQWFMDSTWHYYYLSPQGDVLAEGETPYGHGSHPYVFRAYPFIDGEIHSFVGDIIDQQRYANRLITLYDWIMRASAKGVLLIPEDCIPQGTTPEEFADSWSRFNGVIVYKPSTKYGAVPQQIASNSVNVGINELLSLQLKLFEDISGVNGALQGKPGYSGMSAALYSQQTQNATISLLDILDSFTEFVRDAAYKDVKNMQQFYNERRIVNVAGRNAARSLTYEPDKVRDVEFDLSIVPSTATPVYRALTNDFLMQIWQSGQITLQQMLQAGDFPFADTLLRSIEAQQQAMAQGQPGHGVPADVQAQVAQGADPQAMAMLEQAMGQGEQGAQGPSSQQG